MEAFFALVHDYGLLVYVLLFVYCGLKSGSLPVFAGFAAYKGALDPGVVLGLTFAGGYLGDELRFALARRHGSGLLARWPWAQKGVEKARLLMAHYGVWYIFLYRYPKGMRTIGAFPVGLGPMSWPTFTLLNAASAALWAGLLIGAGYFFGDVFASAESTWALASLALLVGFVALGYFALRRVTRLPD